MTKRITLATLILALAFWTLAQTRALAQNDKDNDRDDAKKAHAGSLKLTNGPVIEHTDNTWVTIAWSTTGNGKTVLLYGTDPNSLNQVAHDVPESGATNRVYLRDLKPNTTYYFQVATEDRSKKLGSVQSVQTKGGASASSSQPSSQSNAPSDQGKSSIAGATSNWLGQGVIVAGPIPQNLTDKSAALWWETSAPSETIVRYGQNPKSLQDARGPSGQQSHQVALSNLTPDTTYYYEIAKSDGSTIANGEFRTLPTSGGKNVQITNGPSIESLSDNQVVITWTTSAQSSSKVRYGTDANNLTQTAEAPWGQTNHRVVVKNLQPNTKYWFRVESSQAQGSGTMAQTNAFPAQTVAQGQQALQITPQH